MSALRLFQDREKGSGLGFLECARRDARKQKRMKKDRYIYIYIHIHKLIHVCVFCFKVHQKDPILEWTSASKRGVLTAPKPKP